MVSLYIPTLASMATLLWLICQNCIMQFVANLFPGPHQVPGFLSPAVQKTVRRFNYGWAQCGSEVQGNVHRYLANVGAIVIPSFDMEILCHLLITLCSHEESYQALPTFCNATVCMGSQYKLTTVK